MDFESPLLENGMKKIVCSYLKNVWDNHIDVNHIDEDNRQKRDQDKIKTVKKSEKLLLGGGGLMNM